MQKLIKYIVTLLAIMISSYFFTIALSSNKKYKIEITDKVKINFDSIFNVLLNDTFYFPKNYGKMYLEFEEELNGFEIRRVRNAKFIDRIRQLKFFLTFPYYSCYLLSESQVKAFKDFHDAHFGDYLDLGPRMECLQDPVQLHLEMPAIFSKSNGNWYLVIHYAFYNIFTGKQVRLNSYNDFYLFFNSWGFCNCKQINPVDDYVSCEKLSLNYPVIFKWDKLTGTWQLRNTKENFETDIKDLGFERVMMN